MRQHLPFGCCWIRKPRWHQDPCLNTKSIPPWLGKLRLRLIPGVPTAAQLRAEEMGMCDGSPIGARDGKDRPATDLGRPQRSC